MDRKRRHRKVLYDLAYKWTPLGPVILLCIICTTLLSVWGQLSPPVVIAFCTTAGILVAFFALSHFILYCTRIKDVVDLEKGQRNRSSGILGSVPGGSPPASQSSRQNVEDHGQSQGQEQQNRTNDRQETQVGKVSPVEPLRLPLRVVNGTPSPLPTMRLHPHVQESVHSHASAVPKPLSIRKIQTGHSAGGIGQHKYQPYRQPDPKTPSQPPRSHDPRDMFEERSSPHTTGLTPEEAMENAARAMGREQRTISRSQQQSRQRRRVEPSVGHHRRRSYALANVPPGRRVESQIFLGPASSPTNLARLSSHWEEVRNQVEPQNRPVELSTDGPQGYLVLLQEPDLMDLLSRCLQDVDARPQSFERFGGEILQKPLTHQHDTDAVVRDNSERRSVRIHDAPVTIHRMRSQSALLVQDFPDRLSPRSSDSGYYSADRLRRSISTLQPRVVERDSVSMSSWVGAYPSSSLGSASERQSSTSSDPEVDGFVVVHGR
ncbi:hypothetical protein SLS53_000380 [Cytospora paraplurivora]|uniref:Uncharacterized protein n=1 Tax=Cytospora paraplurivora TaxID=2898453 RepID=A0AAN9UP47_9PEZI